MKNQIPPASLIGRYLPAHYIDSFSKEIACDHPITPEEFRRRVFSCVPRWIDRLMELRNTIVKPLGLDTRTRFTDNVTDKSPNEEIFGMPDKHLDFHVSMWCGEHRGGRQELRITTVVKYNNWLGRAYFFVIRPFHHLILSSLIDQMTRKS